MTAENRSSVNHQALKKMRHFPLPVVFQQPQHDEGYTPISHTFPSTNNPVPLLWQTIAKEAPEDLVDHGSGSRQMGCCDAGHAWLELEQFTFVWKAGPLLQPTRGPETLGKCQLLEQALGAAFIQIEEAWMAHGPFSGLAASQRPLNFLFI